MSKGLMEGNVVCINNKSLTVKEINNQRLITFKDIDELHERPKGTASRNFQRNRKHLIQNEDYYILKQSDLQKDEIRTLGFSVPNRGITLLTESGYLLLVKSLTDDLAWSVQRQLVNTYFKAKTLVNQSILPTEYLSVINNVSNRLSLQEKSVEVLTKQVGKMETLLRLSLPAPKKTYWKTNMYSTLHKTANITNIDENDILKEIYSKLQSSYGINLNMLKLNFLQSHPNINNIPTVDVVDLHDDVKQVFNWLLDSYASWSEHVYLESEVI